MSFSDCYKLLISQLWAEELDSYDHEVSQLHLVGRNVNKTCRIKRTRLISLFCSQLTVAVGKVKVQKPKFDYFSFQPKELEMDDDGKYADFL